MALEPVQVGQLWRYLQAAKARSSPLAEDLFDPQPPLYVVIKKNTSLEGSWVVRHFKTGKAVYMHAGCRLDGKWELAQTPQEVPNLWERVYHDRNLEDFSQWVPE